MMHKDIIIVTKLNFDISPFEGLDYLILDQAEIHDTFIVTEDNQNITFDYLIIDDLISSIPLLKENKKIITNQFFETSVDNIYAIGEINSSKTLLEDQIKSIIEHIKNPF